ncbi:MAG: DUF5602 domain-containing protein [Anaerolineaceae bacterium]|nr:DUF5602 domain-containing protein [Anaerolineaceae bacterium]MCB9101874.1 DUF5602 domain-containing protein [Anaerolineales bacterium]
MKKWTWLVAGLLIVGGSLSLMGFASNKHTQWGQPVSVGNGQIRTFVSLNGAGKPKEVGVVFTEEMLSGLPDQMTENVLDFPASIEATSFDHFGLDWNPMGHEPDGVYTVPHFDFHFYAISQAEQAAIEAGTCTTEQDSRIPNPPGAVPVTCAVFDKAMQPLPADMMPTDYNLVPAVVPNMGNHLLDFTAPELNGQPFTYTWLYGAYDGQIIFYEPMITKAFLESNPNMCESLKTPEAMPEAGWYPTRYCIKHSQAGVYTIALDSFKWFEASNGQVVNSEMSPAAQHEFVGHHHN